MNVKLDKFNLALDEEGWNALIELLEEHITSFGMRMGIKDFPFAKRILEIIGLDWRQREAFIGECHRKRKQHIDWLLGKSEEDGIQRMPLPKNDEDMRKILLEFDTHWTGEGYYNE